MRVLVTGGRNYQNWRHVHRVLSTIHFCEGTRITAIIEGGATGADTLARGWAIFHGVPVETVPADWKRLGKRAGPLRNRAMAKMHIDMIVAFPGDEGTADMVGVGRKEGIKIYEEASDRKR